MIARLLSSLNQGLQTLRTFLIIVILGLLVAIVWALPWLIRVISVVSWLGGTYLAGDTLNAIYGPYSEPLPLMALWIVPAILAAALPVSLHYKGQLSKIWGAFVVFGLVCLVFATGSSWLIERWPDADLFFRAAPVLLLATLVFFIAPRLKRLRASRKEVIDSQTIPPP